MVRKDYAALVQQLDEAIALDQINICRELLADADEAYSQSSVIQQYYSENEAKLAALRRDIDKVAELLESLKSTQGWTKAKEKK